MKRLLLSLALLVASCAPQLAYAQKASAPPTNTVTLYPETLAITMCQYAGDSVYARTFIDDAVLSDTAMLSETRVHEASHRADIKSDSKRFCAMRARDVLWSEVKAYCAEAPLDVAHGKAASFVYSSTLMTLEWEFSGDLPTHDIIAAWFNKCGKQLGMSP